MKAYHNFFYTYQIVVICSIPDGRWWCDIHSLPQVWRYLWSIKNA